MTLRLKPRSLVVACVLAASFLPASAQLPTLGDDSELTLNAERRLGEKIARELYRDPDYIDDPVLVEYVRGIWQPLLAAARVRGEVTRELDDRFAWQVLLGKDRTINAFALPGGWLGLHLGLMAVASRDELASVLAHELSHVTQRHISRLMTQEKKQAPWVVAAMILGGLAASKSPDAANALIVGGQALAAQNQLSFSRDMEREADRIGFGILSQAGFEPQGFVTMFDKLQQAARLNDSGAYPYLRTHPMTTERIGDMQARQQLVGRVTPSLSIEHQIIMARARTLTNSDVDGLRARVAEAEPRVLAGQVRSRQAAALYAAALASTKLREFGAAKDFITALTVATAPEPAAARLARLLAAETALAQGDHQRAAALVDGEHQARPELFLWSQSQMAAAQPAEAVQKLQTWVALYPRDGAAWQLLASAAHAHGQTLRAIRAEAEAQVAHMDFSAAMDRFRAAQDWARKNSKGADHIEASIIDTRSREVELLLREQALER